MTRHQSVNQFDGSYLDLGARIRMVIKDIGSDVAAESTGKSVRTLDRYASGEVEPPVSVITGLAARSGCSVQWLATGNGPKTPEVAETPHEDVADIPRLDVVASAGPGASGAMEKTLEMVPFPRAFLRSIGVSPTSANIVTVAGDSMEPTLSAGDDLIVDTSVKRIKAEALYVLILDGEVVVKRAQRRVNGSILITSDNDRYPPEEVTPEAARTLHVAGRVVWFGRSI
jgi:phage repressor protein C with HTH and peptisase S24 domain